MSQSIAVPIVRVARKIGINLAGIAQQAVTQSKATSLNALNHEQSCINSSLINDCRKPISSLKRTRINDG